MKQSVLNRTRALVTLGLSAGLLVGHPVMAGSTRMAAIESPFDPGNPKKVKAKAVVSRNNSRNNELVKIYPDIIRRTMHVVAKENNGKEIDFYVFDMEGTLVQNFKMKERDHQQLNGLAKGRYEFRVFMGDEEATNGLFEIR